MIQGFKAKTAHNLAVEFLANGNARGPAYKYTCLPLKSSVNREEKAVRRPDAYLEDLLDRAFPSKPATK